MYQALDVAKYAVSKCYRDGCPISNLQLQKILYYLQIDSLQRDSAAFADDIEAWQFGPVVPKVYYQFCGFGAMPITACYDHVEIDPSDRKNFDRVIEAKRQMNPWELVEETHNEKGAWHQVYQNGSGNHNVIPTSLIGAKD